MVVISIYGDLVNKDVANNEVKNVLIGEGRSEVEITCPVNYDHHLENVATI